MTLRTRAWLSAVVVVLTGTALLTPTTFAANGSTASGPSRSGNLLTPKQASFDGGVTGWHPSNSTAMAGVTSPTYAGTGALAFTNTDTAAATSSVWSASGQVVVPARPGFRYFGRAWVRAQDTGRAVFASVGFLDAQGRLFDKADGQRVIDSGNWQRTFEAVAIAPPNAAYVVLGVAAAAAAPNETHYIDSAELTEAPGGAHRVVGPLRTSGNQVLDGNGNPLVLRGVNRPGLESGDGRDFTVEEISAAQRWGGNVVRIPLGEQLWMPGYCDYDPNFPARVDQAVRTVTDLGMVALLNLHWSVTSPCGKPGLVPMADANGVQFWEQVAARYRDNPLVAFDLYNEPHDLTEDIWRNGGWVTWNDTTYQVSGMQQMYDAVRRTGATNVVTVSGNSWANRWPEGGPLAGSNIVYAIHLYTCPSVPPPNCSNTAPYDVKSWLDPWVQPGQTYPLMVTEFGWPDPQNGVYNRVLIAYAEAHGWGWAAYSWGDTWGEFALLATAGSGTYQPKPTGMSVLAAYPGT